MRARILVVDDEADLLDTCRQVLERVGHAVEPVGDARVALARLEDVSFDLVVTDLRLPGMDGLELLGRLRQVAPETPVVMMTAFPTVETAVEAVKRGAFDYIVKPFSPEQLLQAVARAVGTATLARTNRNLRQALVRGGPSRLIGTSPAFRRTMEQIEQVAPTDATVLVLGETGTGKELLARRIHELSPRRDGPFLAINCAAVPPDLLEAELFGVERGAYTDAQSARPGLLECAAGGTLLLDEVGDLSLPLQGKLLRVVEERAVRRVGGRTLLAVDFRLVAATNRDLEEQVREKRFRDDLYYRLNVIRLVVAPLRERREDIGSLAEHLVRVHAAHYGRPAAFLEPEAMARLFAYDWPGNVRELSNVLERAVLLARPDAITILDLPEEVAAVGTAALPGAAPGEPRSFTESKRQAVEAFERRFIVEALEATGGNVSQAAVRAGLGRSAFQRLMKRYGIHSEDFRPEGGR